MIAIDDPRTLPIVVKIKKITSGRLDDSVYTKKVIRAVHCYD